MLRQHKQGADAAGGQAVLRVLPDDAQAAHVGFAQAEDVPVRGGAFQLAFYLAMIPIACFTMSPGSLFLILSLIAGAITFLCAWNSILGYKIPYMTIPFESYGTYTAVSGAVTGIVGVVASFMFHFLSKYIPLPVVAIIGSLLVLALISLPHDNSPVFLSVFLVAYIGRVIVDYAIPVMLIRVVPADIAGIYNAGRYILLNLSSTVSVFAVGALLGKISALWLLSACALAYIIGMIWYMILYKKYMR